MNTETGKIVDQELLAQVRTLIVDKVLAPETMRQFAPMKIPPTPLQLRTGLVGRNDPCPCGSGLKFKKCCLRRNRAVKEGGA